MKELFCIDVLSSNISLTSTIKLQVLWISNTRNHDGADHLRHLGGRKRGLSRGSDSVGAQFCADYRNSRRESCGHFGVRLGILQPLGREIELEGEMGVELELRILSSS